MEIYVVMNSVVAPTGVVEDRSMVVVIIDSLSCVVLEEDLLGIPSISSNGQREDPPPPPSLPMRYSLEMEHP